MADAKTVTNKEQRQFEAGIANAASQAVPTVQDTYRGYKDTVFRMIFSEKKNLLSLYNALNGTDYTNADDIEITTLKGAFYMRMKNDSSFVFDNTISLYEHQSSPNPNMPLRDLYYITDMLKKRIASSNLYKSTIIRIPVPQFIVFYNGTKEQLPEQTLQLSDMFEKPTDNPMLELQVRVININPGMSDDLLKQCEVLGGYMKFVNFVRAYKADGLSTTDAVTSAVDSCVRDGILIEFFATHRQEVIDTSIYEFDEEAYKKIVEEETVARARQSYILELLQDIGTIPDRLKGKITSETSESTLSKWHKLAARSDSIEEFEKNM